MSTFINGRTHLHRKRVVVGGGERWLWAAENGGCGRRRRERRKGMPMLCMCVFEHLNLRSVDCGSV
ncbi:hypothetical protein Hanom_Chr04g00369531 [Helianthus anomalus]